MGRTTDIMRGGLSVTIQRRPECVVASFFGSAGLSESEVLDQAVAQVLRERPPVIVLDLSGLRFITSLGIRALARVHNGAAAFGGSVRIAGPVGYVADVLRMVWLDQIIPVHPTVDEALRAPPRDPTPGSLPPEPPPHAGPG